MNQSTSELRDQNIRIAEEHGRGDLAYQSDIVAKKIILTESDKQRLKRILSGFAKKYRKEGGEERKSISNNLSGGPRAGGPHNLSGGHHGNKKEKIRP